MTSNMDQLRELIPLYVNGRLPESERQEFEDKLNEYPDLRRDLREFSEIKASYADMKQQLSQPSEALYRRVMAEIRGETKKAKAPKEPGILSKAREFFGQVFASPRLSWSVVAVQLVVIIVLAGFMAGEGRFKTLSSDHHFKGGGIAINIVFDQEAREREIRAILNRIGASIVSGPSAEGLYVIQTKNDEPIERTLNELRKTDAVKFAEKTY